MAFADRTPERDYNSLNLARNANPEGIWSDGTTIWVCDRLDKRIYAYNLEGKYREIDKEFTTLDAAGNDHPRGIWSDGTTMWVADWSDDDIYAYNMETKQRDSSKDFSTSDLDSNNRHFVGIWSNGTTMWVADLSDDKLYAYNLTTKARESSNDFNSLGLGTFGAAGMWSNSTTMWVCDHNDDMLRAYDINTKNRDASKDISVEDDVVDAWSDGTTIWTIHENVSAIYAYTLDTGDRNTEKDFNIFHIAENDSPIGIWGNETTLWISDYDDRIIYAYNRSTKSRDSSKDFTNAPVTQHFGGPIWSNGTTLWLADTGADRLIAYRMSNRQPDSSKDINLTDGNRHPTGIWSNGTTIWVADEDDAKIYAYTINTRIRDSSQDFDTLDDAGNDNPIGLWSDGTTMWVGDRVDFKLYAYDLSTKQRDTARDFTTLNAAGNTNIGGLWSDGITMYVIDVLLDGVFGYELVGITNSEWSDVCQVVGTENSAWSETCNVVGALFLSGNIESAGETTGSSRVIYNLSGEVQGEGGTHLAGNYELSGTVEGAGEVSGNIDLDLAIDFELNESIQAGAGLSGNIELIRPTLLSSRFRINDPSSVVAPVSMAHVGGRDIDDSRVTEEDPDQSIDASAHIFEGLSQGHSLYVYTSKHSELPVDNDEVFNVSGVFSFNNFLGDFTIRHRIAGDFSNITYVIPQNLQEEGLVIRLTRGAGGSYVVGVFSATSGIPINGLGSDIVILPEDDAIIASNITINKYKASPIRVPKVVLDRGMGDGDTWYADVPSTVFNSLGSSVLAATITRGRDSQRQFTPPRVPAMTCEVWDEDGAVYYSRPYKTGTPISLAALMPDGETTQIVFTGYVDAIDYIYNDNVFKYRVTALGTSSKLVNEHVYGPCEENITVSEAITKTLEAANWEFEHDVVDGIFPAILTHWWLDGSSAWNVIQRLVNTQGPPATFYENHLGNLVFLGVGQTGVNSDAPVLVSAPQATGSVVLSAIGKVQEKTVTEYVINRAELEVIEYEEDEEFGDVWGRATEFRILPGALYELTASFSNPVCTYENTDLPDFQSTSDALSVRFKTDGAGNKDLNATRAIMQFDNTGNSVPARVRNVALQGKSLNVVGRSILSSDSLNAEDTVEASQEEHGLVEWGANVYNTVTSEHGQQLVLHVVRNYHEGVEAFNLRLYHNNVPALLETLLRFNEATTLSNDPNSDSSFDASALDNARAYVRKFSHVWKDGIYYVDVEVEARSGDFFGVSPFIIGTSRLNELKGFSA